MSARRTRRTPTCSVHLPCSTTKVRPSHRLSPEGSARSQGAQLAKPASTPHGPDRAPNGHLSARRSGSTSRSSGGGGAAGADAEAVAEGCALETIPASDAFGSVDDVHAPTASKSDAQKAP